MQSQVLDCSGIMEHELLIESEDTSLPLLCQAGVEAPNGTPVAVEQQRVVSEALKLLQGQLVLLQGRNQPNKSETSDLLRDTCQNLSDLVMSLEQTWQKVHPGEPQPHWPVEAIPEEELARIGWDFHANRVQILNTGNSFWNAIGYLIKADQSSSFAKPPSADEVTRALSRTKERLHKEMQDTAIKSC
mmetsp:Transcript_93962/g.148499  ORF Transcript_93962/g.148499 Transcript_93962/m.148499 type:complete len:188 (+) Transcript_93962:67-630(+)